MRQFYFLLCAFGVLIADQVSKWFVMEHIIVPKLPNAARSPLSLTEWYTQTLERLPYAEIKVTPFFNWVMVWNHGISFGMFNQATDYGPMILVALAAIISVWFLIWLFRTDSFWQSLSISFVLGGAIGNAIDRLRFEAVIDFLDFHAMGYHWPAFNIGDSAIVIGVFILVVFTFKSDPSEQTTAQRHAMSKEVPKEVNE